MKYNMIVAIDNKNGIGKNNSIPWYFPNDLKYFAKLTRGNGSNAVIMGRKTYESIGKSLPGRVNLVLSSKYIENKDNVIFIQSIDQIEKICRNNSISTAWIIGGGLLYSHFLKTPKLINELYVTKIDNNYNCDIFFPNQYQSLFKKKELIKKEKEGDIEINYLKYFS